jgi:tetratricopeptide (TPR) repeat protein
MEKVKHNCCIKCGRNSTSGPAYFFVFSGLKKVNFLLDKLGTGFKLIYYFGKIMIFLIKKSSPFFCTLRFLILFWGIINIFILQSSNGETDKARTELIRFHQKYITILGCSVWLGEETKKGMEGNGFVVDDFGKTFTVRHNIAYSRKKCNAVEVRFIGDGSLRGSPFWASKPRTCKNGKDLALLEPECNIDIRKHGCEKVTFLDDSSRVYSTTRVWVTGYDFDRGKMSAIPGYISACAWIKKLGDKVLYIQPDAGYTLNRGFSGSPVFFENTGLVIGCLQAFNDVDTVITELGQKKEILNPPYYAIRREVIKDFLRNQAKLEVQEEEKTIVSTPTPIDPDREEEQKWRFSGMMDLIQSSILDIINRYRQFEEKLDTDVLLETWWEIESFSNKLRNDNYKIQNQSREQAISFFIKGLAMKATRQRGLLAAVEYFERAIEEDSTFPDAMYQMALYHFRYTGDLAETMHHLRRALEFEPENGEVLRTMGMYYLYSPKADSAKYYLDRAQEILGGEDPRLAFYSGIYYDPYWSIIKELVKSDSIFEAQNKRRPNHLEYQDMRDSLLAKISDMAEKLDSAVHYYETSRRAAPGYIRPLNALIWDLGNEILRSQVLPSFDSAQDSIMRKRLNDNLSDLLKFVGFGLVDVRTFNTIALGYLALDDCASAMEYVQKSRDELERSPLSPQYLFDLLRENERIETICAHKGK